MNKIAIIGIGVGSLAILGTIVYLVTKNKDDEKSMDGGFGSTTGSAPDFSTPDPTPAPTPPARRLPDTRGDKKGTKTKWKEYKSEIKPVCGRRQYAGKSKVAWYDCVGEFSGFDGVADVGSY